MDPNPIETAKNADLRGSLPALVVRRNGALEHLYPQPGPANQRVQEPSGKYGDPI